MRNRGETTFVAPKEQTFLWISQAKELYLDAALESAYKEPCKPPKGTADYGGNR